MIFTRLTNDDGMKIKERTFSRYSSTFWKKEKTKKDEKKKVQKKKERKHVQARV